MADITKAQYSSTAPSDMILKTYSDSFTVTARPGALGSTRGLLYQVDENLKDMDYSTPFGLMIFSIDGGTTWYQQSNEAGLVNGVNTVGTVTAQIYPLQGTTPYVFIYVMNGMATDQVVTYKVAIFASSINEGITGIV